MKRSQALGRRDFLKAGALGVTALSAPGWWAIPSSLASSHARDPFRGLKVGVTSYTFRKFSLDEAIAMTVKAGLKYISLKDVHLPLQSTRAQRQEVRKKIEDAGLTLMGCGVVYMKNNEAEIRNVFEYAKDCGMPTIIAGPEPAALDILDKMVRQYDIRVAIHNHGPTDKYYPSPLDVLKYVKDHDERIGVCADIGHTIRVGVDPVEAIRKSSSRLYDIHFKDEDKAAPDGKTVEVGRGVIDIPGVLKALLDIKYQYHVAMEYEKDPENPFPGLVESLAYMRGVLAALAKFNAASA